MKALPSDFDPRPFDQAATDLCQAEIATIRPDQLDLPTPCAEWTLGELIAHLVAENRGFAAAAVGAPDPSAWRPGPPDEITVTLFPWSVDKVTAAFAADGVLEREVEVREFGVFPGRVAVGMHFIDYLVHAWDVARSLDRLDPIPHDLAEAALRLHALFPSERPDGSSFAPVVPVHPLASASSRLLALAGRDPEWRTQWSAA